MTEELEKFQDMSAINDGKDQKGKPKLDDIDSVVLEETEETENMENETAENQVCVTEEKQSSSADVIQGDDDNHDDTEAEESVSIEYGSIFDSDDLDFIADNADEEVQQEDVTDMFIKVFIVKKRKALIDQEDVEDDIVDYEESVRRLFVLVTSFATMLAVTNTIMLIIFVRPHWFETTKVVKQSLPSNIHSFPHVSLLFNDGSMEIYEQSSNNFQLKHSWSFKIPKQKSTDGAENGLKYLGYISFISKENVFVIYCGGNKDTTVLYNDGNGNLTHNSVIQSKIPKDMFYDPRFVQIDKMLWIFGGRKKMFVSDYHGYKYNVWDCDANHLEHYDRNTLIWNTQRKLYYPGPKLPLKEMAKGCPISLNKTHVLILFIKEQNCLAIWVYSFDNFQWKELNGCLHETHLGLEIVYNDLKCTSTMEKHKQRNTLVVISRKSCYDTLVHLGIIDWGENSYKKYQSISHNFTHTSEF